MNKNCSPLVLFENSGFKTNPLILVILVSSSTGTNLSLYFLPKIETILCLVLVIGKLKTTLLLWCMVK